MTQMPDITLDASQTWPCLLLGRRESRSMLCSVLHGYQAQGGKGAYIRDRTSYAMPGD
jgi:hypothetical protein